MKINCIVIMNIYEFDVLLVIIFFDRIVLNMQRLKVNDNLKKFWIILGKIVEIIVIVLYIDLKVVFGECFLICDELGYMIVLYRVGMFDLNICCM